MAQGAKYQAHYKSRSGSIAKRRATPSLLNFGLSVPGTSRNNRFSALAEQNDMDVNYESNISSAEKQPKPPPIVTDASIPLREIKHLLGDDCNYKRTSIGTKVFPLNVEKYEFCKKALKENSIEFHTYNSKANRLFTSFIYGLPRVGTDEIIKEL